MQKRKCKSAKYGELFQLINLIACYFLVQYMLPENHLKMDFFGEGTEEISSMRVFLCYDCWFSSWSSISSVTEYYADWGQSCWAAAIAPKTPTRSRDKCDWWISNWDFAASNCNFTAAAIWALWRLAGILWCGFGCSAMILQRYAIGNGRLWTIDVTQAELLGK
jgi:K(+)-stimulated pyrophosphate-energized sodium pump